MIYVVHMPEGGEPRAWFAFDGDDFQRKVALDDPRAAHEIWDCATAADLLDAIGMSPQDPGVADRVPGVWQLGEACGWNTALFRADYLQEPGLYATEPLRQVDACCAALRARGGQWRVYDGEAIALAAVDRPDALYDSAGGWRARWALRQQLIAVEALADDL